MKTTSLDTIERVLKLALKTEMDLRRDMTRKTPSALAAAAQLSYLGQTLAVAAKLASHLEIEARMEAGQGDRIECYI